MNTPTLDNWLGTSDYPFVIAGPCSAETEEQVLSTAHSLALDPRVKAFRAGVWKPRTRPGSFEGLGLQALPWLQRVQEETHLPVAIEVANAHHVEQALKHGIKILWVGARTTVNPFSVQEIADSLRGVHIPVLVKNPVNPDLDLWIGAVERLQQVGISQLAVVHRGFASYIKTMYRNVPEWNIPIEFRRRMPGIPMLCDPSHITGKSELIQQVAQKALDLAMDGLMIETHPDPAHAWSDARQQVTPAALKTILDDLVVRCIQADQAVHEQLDELRARLDVLDRGIVTTLAERMDVVKIIGQLKRDNNITVLQLKRWTEVIENLMQLGSSLGLPEKDVKTLFDLIHDSSIRTQESIIHAGEKPILS